MDNPRSAPSSSRRDWLCALILFALAVAVFWPATGYEFIDYDDPPFVQENPFVNTGLSWANIRWAFTAVCEQWWLPLLWISFMLDATLFGPGPFGFHLVNILLHAANAALLYGVLRRLTGSRPQSLFLAALFALHPLRVESVAWITARKDVLSGLFFMLALLAYLHHAARPSRRRLAGVGLLMLAGLMTKAILITLPFLLLLLDYWPLRRAGDPLARSEWRPWLRLVREKWFLFLLAAIFIAINLSTHTTGRGDTAGLTLARRLALIPPNYWTYARLLAWPQPLSILHPGPDIVAAWHSVLALLGLGIVTAVLFRLRFRQPALIVGWLWFLIALTPTIRGLRMGTGAFSERFAYLPSIGFFLVVLAGGGYVTRNWRHRQALGAVLALAVLGACVVKTRATLPLWRNTVALFENARQWAPGDPLAYIKLADQCVRAKHYPEAEALLMEALRGNPGDLRTHLSLVNVYAAGGRRPLALTHLRLISASSGAPFVIANNLAWLLATQPNASPGDVAEALQWARRAQQSVPVPNISVLDTLGVVYAANGQFAEAIQAAEEARRLALENRLTDLAERIATRLSSYRAGHAWEE